MKLPTFSISSEKDVELYGPRSNEHYPHGRRTERSPTIGGRAQQSVSQRPQSHDPGQSSQLRRGAQTGTISWSVDRYIIRGFVGEGDYVDGFRTQTDKNTDINLVDHVEIIKGPSAIFIGNQSSTVGGVINKISKESD